MPNQGLKNPRVYSGSINANLYTVSYRLIVMSTPTQWYEKKVKCIAYDQYQAISRVSQWVMGMDYIGEEKILPGKRDVSITEVQLCIEDAGALSELPEVFEE